MTQGTKEQAEEQTETAVKVAELTEGATECLLLLRDALYTPPAQEVSPPAQEVSAVRGPMGGPMSQTIGPPRGELKGSHGAHGAP